MRGGDWHALPARLAAAVAMAYARLLAAHPRTTAMTPWQQARTREDLRWTARCTAAAVATGDRTVVEDLVAWLVRRLDGREEPEAPTGAETLRGAALDAVG